MKILTSDKFAKKFKSLPIDQMDAFFGYFHKYRDWPVRLFIRRAEVKLVDKKDNIFVCRIGESLRVFFTIVGEDKKESLLLLDILTHSEVTP
jgi:hypothetical protein